MEENQFKFKAEVWLYPGPNPWHFISLPKKQSEEIKKTFGARARGWGSLPVQATILRRGSGQVGKSVWQTSIFPDKKSGSYLLPLKAEVRKKEKITAGDRITFSLVVLR